MKILFSIKSKQEQGLVENKELLAGKIKQERIRAGSEPLYPIIIIWNRLLVKHVTFPYNVPSWWRAQKIEDRSENWPLWYTMMQSMKRWTFTTYMKHILSTIPEIGLKQQWNTAFNTNLATYWGRESSRAVLIKSFHTTWLSIVSLICLVLSSPVALMVSMYVVLGVPRFGWPCWSSQSSTFEAVSSLWLAMAT